MFQAASRELWFRHLIGLAGPAPPLAGRVLADAQPLGAHPVRRARPGEEHNP
jgi:hypothetical protein